MKQITVKGLSIQFDHDGTDQEPLAQAYKVIDLINETLQGAGLSCQPQLTGDTAIDNSDVDVSGEDESEDFDKTKDDPERHYYPSEGWMIAFNTDKQENEVQRIDELDILKSDKDAIPLARVKGYIFKNIKNPLRVESQYPRRDTFYSKYTQQKQHIGKRFEILGLSPDQRNDAPYELFDIVFEDGGKLAAWYEEIFNIRSHKSI